MRRIFYDDEEEDVHDSMQKESRFEIGLYVGFDVLSILFTKVPSFNFFLFILSLCSLSFSPCSDFFLLLYRHEYIYFYTVAVDLTVLLEGEKLKQ